MIDELHLRVIFIAYLGRFIVQSSANIRSCCQVHPPIIAELFEQENTPSLCPRASFHVILIFPWLSWGKQTSKPSISRFNGQHVVEFRPHLYVRWLGYTGLPIGSNCFPQELAKNQCIVKFDRLTSTHKENHSADANIVPEIMLEATHFFQQRRLCCSWLIAVPVSVSEWRIWCK